VINELAVDHSVSLLCNLLGSPGAAIIITRRSDRMSVECAMEKLAAEFLTYGSGVAAQKKMWPLLRTTQWKFTSGEKGRQCCRTPPVQSAICSISHSLQGDSTEVHAEVVCRKK
jgi:hypothetical protein